MRITLLLSLCVFFVDAGLTCLENYESELCSLMEEDVTTNLLAGLPAKNFTSTRRKKRALTFPKGSAFVLTITLLKPIQVKVPSNWNLDLEFDMIWPIPPGVDGWKPKPKRRPLFWPHRRHRRQLYANFELALDSQSLPGNQCILRTICESKFILNPPGVSLAEDILRVVFSYPRSGSSTDYDNYDNAYATKQDCDIAYPCPFSLIDLLLHFNSDASNYK